MNPFFLRMIQLAEDTFATRNDPDQLDVDESVMERLQQIHPATLSEYYQDGEGPLAWVLIFPTTDALMRRFLSGEISERQLFDQTQPGMAYDALYLCSGLVLEEFRRKGIAQKLALDAVAAIRKDHPIRNLFVWAHTPEGAAAAEALAAKTGLPLLKKAR